MPHGSEGSGHMGICGLRECFGGGSVWYMAPVPSCHCLPFPDSDDALLKMTIGQQEFSRTGLPDLSSMTEEEQIAYAMQMSLQGAGEPGLGGGFRMERLGWGNGTEQTDLFSSEFGQAESSDIDASSAMDTSEPAKVSSSR